MRLSFRSPAGKFQQQPVGRESITHSGCIQHLICSESLYRTDQSLQRTGVNVGLELSHKLSGTVIERKLT